MVEDEDLLLAVLNSSPVVAGSVTEQLDGPQGEELATRYGGTGSTAELRALRRARAAVHAAEGQGCLEPGGAAADDDGVVLECVLDCHVREDVTSC